MPFTLGGVPVAFNVQQFETLVEQAASFSFRWKTSSMRALRDLANANATGAAMRQALTLVPQDRAVNYQEALKYLVYHYPGVIPPTDVVAVGNPQTGATFAEWVRFLNDFRRIRNDPDDVPESVGDVVYGADHGRTQAPYTGMNMMIMDNFNNAANIGTGFAFNRMWNMLGTLDADALSVRQTVTNSVQNQNAIGQQAMQQYYKGLTNSRYNPELVMGLSKDKLSKDRHKNTTQFQTHFQNDKKNRKKAEDHSVMHARMVKAVRRAELRWWQSRVYSGRISAKSSSSSTVWAIWGEWRLSCRCPRETASTWRLPHPNFRSVSASGTTVRRR
jgi:hypothetical protein